MFCLTLSFSLSLSVDISSSFIELCLKTLPLLTPPYPDILNSGKAFTRSFISVGSSPSSPSKSSSQTDCFCFTSFGLEPIVTVSTATGSVSSGGDTSRLGTLDRDRTIVFCSTVMMSVRLLDLWFRGISDSWCEHANVCLRCGASCSSSSLRSSIGKL